jgi:hypothetical protein
MNDENVMVAISKDEFAKALGGVAMEALRKQANDLFSGSYYGNGQTVNDIMRNSVLEAVRGVVQSPEVTAAIRDAVLTVVADRKDDIVQLILGGWVKEAMRGMPQAGSGPTP